MTTKQISNSQGQTGLPASDLIALPPAPGKAQNPKRSPGAKDFASVIDQAASNSAGKPAHVRTTKSAGRGRRDEQTGESVRERNSTPVREMRTQGRHSRADDSAAATGSADDRSKPTSTSETEVAATSDQQRRNSESRPAPGREKSAKNSAASAKAEGSADEVSSASIDADEAPEETKAAAQETTPTNIVPFPGTANAVIIPFPLAEAQAAPASAQTAAPAAVHLVADTAGAADAVAANSPMVETSAAEPSRATNTKAAPAQGSIDVSALGLKPVKNGETASLALVAEGVASTRQTNEAEASNNSPASNVVSVAFNPVQATRFQTAGNASAVAAQTQLPVEPSQAEESARQPLDTPASASSAKIVLLRTDAAKPAPDAVESAVVPAPAGQQTSAGISGARQEDRMESMTASKHAAAGNTASAESAFEAPAEFTTGNRAGLREVSDESDGSKVAADWQSGRSVAPSDQPALETSRSEPSTASASVERISSLVLREASLVKKYSSDSMAVVLRPDAETELFVHLTQRNGQVEASVRCERGDAQHLSALWPQLQESLAQQKVRLAPLEDSAGSRGNTNFQPPAGSLMSGGGERGTRQDARPSQQQSMDEWPATPASAADAQHVRGARGTRGRRISTSRPGWETWA